MIDLATLVPLRRLHAAWALVAATLLALPSGATAQVPACSTEPVLYPTPAPARVDSYPAQVVVGGSPGTCGSYITGVSAAGIVAGYWCQASPDRQPTMKVWAVRWSSLTPEMMASFLAIPLSSDPGEAARAHQAKYVTASAWNMPDVICEPATDWRTRFNAAMPVVAAPPPPSPWRTAGTGTLYLSAGTRLGSIISGRKAPVDVPCACSATPITYFGGTFCPLASGPPAEVTLCRLN